MNKGTALATGEFVLYLNAGDELHHSLDIEAVIGYLRGTSADVSWMICIEKYPDGKEVRLKTRHPRWAWYCMPASHQVTFFRRTALGAAPYDTRYRIAADYDLVCRLIKAGRPTDTTDRVAAISYRGGVSHTEVSLSLEEENNVRLNHFNISPVFSRMIMGFKAFNLRLARVASLRAWWRRRI